MAAEKPTRRLGRGLDALFSPKASDVEMPGEPGALRDILIASIRSNPFQPRKHFAEAELGELQQSLEATGLLQPITVRPTKGIKNAFELIAGERRLRAASNIGWKHISAVVKELTDQEMLTLALVENLQRMDLNPVEEAEGYSRLIDEFSYTQQSVATMVGKDRSTVANVLRILQLPGAVRQLLRESKLSAGQARPLLGLRDEPTMIALADETVTHGLSARDVERRVREAGAATPTGAGGNADGPYTDATPRKGRPRKTDSRPAEVKDIEESFRKHLQTDVVIAMKSGEQGSITISFYSADDLERLAELIGLTRNPH